MGNEGRYTLGKSRWEFSIEDVFNGMLVELQEEHISHTYEDEIDTQESNRSEDYKMAGFVVHLILSSV
jgi:hypothetical protein